MQCIYCTHPSTRVINSRSIQGGAGIWRRRLCDSCARKFTTKETANEDNLFVIKRNGVRQRFIYAKLFASIYTVIHFGKNKDSGSSALTSSRITDSIVEMLMLQVDTTRDVTSASIITHVHSILHKQSPAWAGLYVHFSAYRTSLVRNPRQ